MPPPDPWLEIRLQDHDDRIWWLVRSNASASRARAGSPKVDWVPDGEFLIPADLPDWLNETVSTLGDEEGPHATGPVTLPVFIDLWHESILGRGVDLAEQWERVEDTIVHSFGIDPELITTALETPRRVRPRRPVELPYHVMACDDRGRHALSQIDSAYWYSGAVPEFGMVLDSFDLSEPMPRGCDILVCGEDTFRDLSEETEIRPSPQARLYFVLCASDDPRDRLRRLSRAVPRRASTIWVGESDAFDLEFLRSLMEGIIHDYPLHQALKAALRPLTGPSWSQLALLVSDPEANQHLRMRDSALRMYERSLDLRERFDFGSVEQLLEMTPEGPPPPENAAAMIQARDASIRLLAGLPLHVLETADFTQESIGLEPRADLAKSIADVREARSQADTLLRNAMSTPMRERMSKLQERRVNLRLLRRSPKTYERFVVEKGESLTRGGRYRLRVNIGRLAEGSLIVGDSPPIDALLPEPQSPEGYHVLSIVLQTLDFVAQGPTLRRLELPPLGPSNSAGFDLVAPDNVGCARLRVLVYLEHTPDETDGQAVRNHLVQSLLLQAEVTNAGDYMGGDVTTAQVEFSRSQRFANLDDLDGRALSIAFNQDPDLAHHTLKLKIGTAHHDLALTEAEMSQALKDFRNIMQHAAYRDPSGLSGPKFLDGQAAADREPDFDLTVRRLADLGWGMWSSLIQTKVRRNRKLVQLIKTLEFGSDLKIQIVPLHATLFPWASIYDAPAPDEGVSVCRGYQRRQANGDTFNCADCLEQCLHPDRSRTVCIYGFWGARFPIEQLISSGTQCDAVTRVRPVQGRALHLSVGLEGGPASLLPTELGNMLGAQQVLEYNDTVVALDQLWDSPDRAAVLLIVGHTEFTLDSQRGPINPRITLPGTNQWIRPQDIGNKLHSSGYQFLEDPSPIVILAACDSASVNLSTFADFIEQFDSAGAAAVVGTETPVVEQFAAAFGKRLVAGLFKEKESLSAALLAFRREGLLENNPLGFCVTAFGDAELG